MVLLTSGEFSKPIGLKIKVNSLDLLVSKQKKAKQWYRWWVVLWGSPGETPLLTLDSSQVSCPLAPERGDVG